MCFCQSEIENKLNAMLIRWVNASVRVTALCLGRSKDRLSRPTTEAFSLVR